MTGKRHWGTIRPGDKPVEAGVRGFLLGFFGRLLSFHAVNLVKQPSVWRWTYAVALAGTIVWASGHGQVAGPSVVNFDKLVHFSVFGLLATLVRRSRGVNWAWLSVVIVSVFGAADELRQSFTPGRSMEFADWIADTTGAALAVALYALWPWYRRLLETRLWERKPKIEAALVSAKKESAS